VTSGAHDFEALLREALTPVEPSVDLTLRLERTLVNLTELAQDELESWELRAMRDPRNWIRPAAAVVVGAGAGSALVLLRARNRHRARRQQAGSVVELTEHTLADVAGGARRLLPARWRALPGR
jgi:hypothetical protein